MPFKVGLAQISPRLGDLDFNFEKHLEFIKDALQAKVDLLIFPELSLSGYFLQDLVKDVAISLDDRRIQELEKLSVDISLVVSLVEQGDNAPYISSLYLEGGQIKHIHRKVYLPTQGLFEDGMYYGRGEEIRAFDTRFGRIGMLICRDVWHLSAPYLLAQDGANYLILVNASPVRGIGKEIPDPDPLLKNLFKVYSYFLNLYIFFAHRVGFEDGLAYYGGSTVIDPFGDTLALGSYFHEELVSAEIDPELLRRKNYLLPLRRDEDLELTLRELERIIKDGKNR